MARSNRLFWCVCGVVALATCAGTEASAEKAPYHVLYSNDTNNIETCVSPFHREGEPFRQEMLEATVDETAGTGIEVHMLQPGLGWVPLWKSKAYPFEEHVRFMKEKCGKEPAENGYAQYMANGGDIVGAFVSRCRKKGLVPFVSMRLNDAHGQEFVDMPHDKIPDWAWLVLAPIHVDHPDWRINQNIKDWYGRVLNWANPEVPKLKFQFIKEICEQYDIDGFELDFMRHCSFFRAKETTSEQRQKIMVDFIEQTRKLLDRTAKEGRHRWLCVRIPCYLEAHDPLGINVQAFAEAGVDMFDLSPYFFTEQQTDAPAIKALLPDSSVYLEMTHTTSVGKNLTKDGYDNFDYRRTTDLQFYTAAHLAYARGLDGVSAFNFVYYREHGEKVRGGSYNEPPFKIFEHLGDPEWLARQPQHYILGAVWNSPPVKDRPLPKVLGAGESATFKLDMAPPIGGWKNDGRMRIQAETSLGDSVWTARLNGAFLEETADRSEPYASPYRPMLGSAEQHRAWIVPATLLKDGVNTIDIQMQQGEGDVKLVFFDLAIGEVDP